jgi:serine/threonine protein phosphatase 1
MLHLFRPRKWHRSLPTLAPGERIYAIGDIHGRLDLVCELLRLIREDQSERGPAETHYVILGDFIDRGPDTAAIISMLRQWQRDLNRVTILKGNHEAALLLALHGNKAAERMWLKHGGRETLRSFGIEAAGGHDRDLIELAASRLPPADLSWLEQLPVSHRFGDYFFCHAGVRPGVPLDEQQADDLLWGTDDFLRSRRYHGAVIVHGHNICGSAVEFAGNRICVDTGAYASGVLSAVGLDGHRQWSLSTRPSPAPAAPAVKEGLVLRSNAVSEIPQMKYRPSDDLCTSASCAE